ncbi:CAP domain-containing protein [Paraburkholderia sp. A1RI-2L]|uniref:CAP domain-containing protein n=1 Tax=Paraburkholderia sp. A1RI-2L TaxID=3028367 RepID=UPI003B77565C
MNKEVNKSINAAKFLTSIAFCAALAACGGGGGSGGSSSPASTAPASAPGAASSPAPASSPVTGTQTTPQYAANTAPLAMFNQVNAYRQQCGFPAVQQNTVLDQAAQAHAMYLGLNSVVSDTETAGQQGFTGVSYLDRAVHFGFPSAAIGGGVSANYYTNSTLSETQYGQNLVYAWIAGVYHAPVLLTPVTTMGVGEYETAIGGFPAAWGSLSLLNPSMQQVTTSGPLTFPCQGTTGVPYKDAAESPTPPNTSGAWGTPVVVMGNATDTIVLQSGTMTDPSGNVINLQLLDSANDPNKLIQPYEAVAYPATPLAPNTTYTVNVTGTMNGNTFTKPPFTFTTGNIVG